MMDGVKSEFEEQLPLQVRALCVYAQVWSGLYVYACKCGV